MFTVQLLRSLWTDEMNPCDYRAIAEGTFISLAPDGPFLSVPLAITSESCGGRPPLTCSAMAIS
jgi:hypothetical protein